MSHGAKVTAVFRNGIFTPDEPVSLPEGTRVRLSLATVQNIEEDEELLKLERETKFFAEHQAQLQTLHPNQYVAIHNTQVVDSDSDEIQLILRIQADGDEEGILVIHVDDVPVKEYFVPSIRLERDA